MLIPESLGRVLMRAVNALATGNAVSILPIMTELTTQQAADFVKESRPHLVKLLERRAIPFHTVGTHRRVYLRDLLLYQQARDARAKAALDALADDAREMGIYGE